MRNKYLATQFLLKNPNCGNCGEKASEAHHVIPLVLGGNDIESNLFPLCSICHAKIHHTKDVNRSALTKAGLERAKAAGKQLGQKKGSKLRTQKSIITKELMLNKSKSFHGDLSDKEIIELTGVSRTTFYKYKKELKEAEEGKHGIN